MLIIISSNKKRPGSDKNALNTFWIASILFTNNLNQDPFFPLSIKFTIKNLFPGPEVQFSISNSNHNFSSHNLSFEVSIPVGFKSIMLITGNRFMRGQFLQPVFIVIM